MFVKIPLSCEYDLSNFKYKATVHQVGEPEFWEYCEKWNGSVFLNE